MEPTRVLLVNAVNPFVEAQNRYPSLGLGYLVAMLNRELGDAVEVRLVEEEVAATIRDWRPHLLGLSSVSQNYNLATSYAELGREAGFPVASIPGPSAFAAALAASGQPPLPAVLIGFLPPKQGRRRSRLAEPIMAQATTVVFLSPHRLGAEIRDAADVLGEDRPATLMAELSKKHERAEVGTLGSLAVGREVQKPRGEYVLVIGPPPTESRRSKQPGATEAREAYRAALDITGERREAMRIAARELGLGRREFYSLLVENEDL